MKLVDERIAPKLLDEVRFVLGLASILFRAFKIQKYRFEQWQLVQILLAKTDSELQVRRVREDSKIVGLLGKHTPFQRNHLYKKLITGFRNKDGPFLQVIGGRTSERYYKFTTHFDDSARDYVEIFRKEMLSAEIASALPSREPKDELKIIMAFINDEYWEAWKRFAKIISAGASPNGIAKRALPDELTKHAVYWVTLLTIWRNHLNDNKISTAVPGIEKQVYDVLQAPEVGETLKRIKFLVKNGIVESYKDNGIRMHALLDRFVPLFKDYTEELAQLRVTLLSLLK